MTELDVGTGEAVPRDTEAPGEVLAQEGEAARASLTARRRWVIGIAAGAVVLAGAGLGAATVVRSPAQAAADAGPPPMDVLVARVEKRVLRDTVIVRGTATAAQTLRVTPAAAPGAAGAPVVTKLPVAAGDKVTAGKVLLEVSGRPVFALPGKVPVYRDLKPGAEGEDVAQLQKALAARGHGTDGDTQGVFGAGTKSALAGFYASIGYEPLPAVEDGGEAVEAAEDAVTAAARALQDAQDGAAGAGQETEDGEKPAAEPGGHAVERAQQDLTEAQRELAEARAVAGPMLPSAEVVFLKGFPARVDSVSAQVGSQSEGPALTVSGGGLEVRALLQDHQKGLVRPGQKVEILSEVSGVTAAAKVLSVAEEKTTPPPPPGSGEGGGGDAAPAGEPGYVMIVRPDHKLDPALAGQDVRLTVEAAATDGDALVVPVSAVSAGADGRTTVTVVDGSGKRRRAEVRAGTTGDGYVEVVPAPGTSLKEGDEVITGVNPGLSDGAGEAGGAP
ncbi:peptidoglycan-binding protein [Streptomyces sp. CO7]